MSNSNNNNGRGNEGNDGTRSNLSDIERIILGIADTVLGYMSRDPPATHNNLADALQRAVASRHSHESLNNLQEILNGTSNTSASSTSANQSSTTITDREKPPARSTTNLSTDGSRKVQFNDTEAENHSRHCRHCTWLYVSRSSCYS